MVSVGGEAPRIVLLYVDDESALLDICKRYLEKTGDFTVDTVESAHAALEKIRTTSYDAIVSDYQMPVMDGIAFLKHLKAEGNTTPFIIFTGKGREEVVVEALNAGADFYLQEGADPTAQFADLSSKIHCAVSRRRAEEALRASEEKYRALVDLALEAILIFDFSGTVLFANHATATLVEIDDPSALTGRNAQDFIAPESRDAVFADFASVMEGRDAYLAQYKVITATGREIYVESIGKKIQFGGAPADIVMLRDITERKKTEEALQESKQTFQALAENANDGILVAVAEGAHTYANRRASEITGYSVAELLKTGMKDLAASAEVKNLLIRFGKRLAGEIDLQQYETLIIRKDGKTVPIEFTGAKTFWHGQPADLIIFRDITDRKREEETLLQANKQLNLLSGITRHDILNQLMTLKGYLELSREVIDNPTALIEYITKEEEAANTIEDQIMFTRDYQELGAAAPAWQNVNANIQKAVAGLPMRDVRVDVDRTDLDIISDPLFEKVFYNLVDNALRYGGDQMKTIQVSLQESDQGLIVVCEDDGVGITDEDKKQLFSRGFGKNTGLGLFLSREILGITGITITENSIPGEGARFEITVPKGMWRITKAEV